MEIPATGCGGDSGHGPRVHARTVHVSTTDAVGLGLRPVLYLDVDDTLLTFSEDAWAGRGLIGNPNEMVAGDGARELVEWALEHMEVRWLTWWCPSGVMQREAAARLGRALDVEPTLLETIRGLPWMSGRMGLKVNGIDWTEHAAGREWFWVEDDLLPLEVEELEQRKCADRYIHCNVTRDPSAIRKAFATLREKTQQPDSQSVVTGVP